MKYYRLNNDNMIISSKNIEAYLEENFKTYLACEDNTEGITLIKIEFGAVINIHYSIPSARCECWNEPPRNVDCEHKFFYPLEYEKYWEVEY